MAQEIDIIEPVCVEVTVSHSADGKIAINEYGKRTSGWGVFMSRKYQIPLGWTEDQVSDFQKEKHEEIYKIIDEIDVREHDIRFKARDW